MPMVNGKEYPYTKKGIAAAEKASGKKMMDGKGDSRKMALMKFVKKAK